VGGFSGRYLGRGLVIFGLREYVVDDEFLKSVPNLRTFAVSLVGAAAEVEEYTGEIESNREFHKQMEGNRSNYGSRSYYSWGPGIGNRLGTVLYALCRELKPEAVVETGVAGGVSSSYILCALAENKRGQLCSIDLPWGEGQSGWIIPDHLKSRWQLFPGRSSEQLSPLLEMLGTIDIFLHDSDHSYQNMFWEYQTAWMFLKSGGLLLSHNIDMNSAFPDFCRSVGVGGFRLGDMGGLVKD